MCHSNAGSATSTARLHLALPGVSALLWWWAAVALPGVSALLWWWAAVALPGVSALLWWWAAARRVMQPEMNIHCHISSFSASLLFIWLAVDGESFPWGFSFTLLTSVTSVSISFIGWEWVRFADIWSSLSFFQWSHRFYRSDRRTDEDLLTSFPCYGPIIYSCQTDETKLLCDRLWSDSWNWWINSLIHSLVHLFIHLILVAFYSLS